MPTRGLLVSTGHSLALPILPNEGSERERDIKSDHQLPLYLRAGRDLYDKPIRSTGYAYIGPTGPAVQTRPFDDDELDAVESEAAASMAAIERSQFGQYAAGSHCQWCAHNGLPCADDSD